MRVLISGGGTGGHIYPGLALIEELASRVENLEVHYLGSCDGMEKDIVPKRGVPFSCLPAQGFERKLSFDTVKTLFVAIQGFFISWQRVRAYKPDLVIGTGGYVAGPVLMAAALLGKPTLIHEQNALPSLTNRILAPFVDAVALSFSEASAYLSRSKKTVTTGNPIREEFFSLSKEQGIERLGLNPKKKTLFFVGGSRGAEPINNAALAILPRLIQLDDLQVILVAGQVNYDQVLAEIKSNSLALPADFKILPYLDDMPAALNAADLIVARAGGMIAEINACGLPAIYIPSPYVADNHQEHNAKAIEALGAAITIREADLDNDLLYARIADLLADQEKREFMSKAALSLAKPNACKEIADLALEILATKEKGV